MSAQSIQINYDAQHWCDNCDRSYSTPRMFAGLLLCAQCCQELTRMLDEDAE